MATGEDEVRQQRHGEPASHERETHGGVVGPVADVGLEAAVPAARALGHLLPGHPHVTARPGLAGELAEWHCVLVAACDGVPGWQEEVDRVSEQLVALQAGGQPPWLVLP